jgi:hypothetical protein
LARAVNTQTRIDRLFSVAAAAGDDDPNFSYDISYGGGHPPRPLSQEPAVRINLERDGHYLRLAAHRRAGSPGVTGVWYFTDDDAGAIAKHEALRAVGRGDYEVAVESGIEVKLTTPPKRLEEALSLVPPEQRGQARVRFTPGPGIPLMLIAHGDERIKPDFTVYPFPSIDGFDRSYVGLDRAVMPLLGFRLPEPPRVELGFRPLLDLGENATVNAEATSFALPSSARRRSSSWASSSPTGA